MNEGKNKMYQNGTSWNARGFKERTGFNFKCPHCAGALRYSIEHKKMQCGQCDGLFDISSIPDPTAASAKDKNAEMETVEYRCPSCGASLHTTQTGTTSFCSFCGSDVVLKERVSSMKRPARILPFTMSREECVEVYKERIRESWLVPGDMNARDAASRFRPVYIPFWCLSGEGDGPSVRQCTVPTTEGTNTVREDTYEEKLTGSISVGGIYYDACSQFDDETAQWLQFSDKDTVPFHPAYLS